MTPKGGLDRFEDEKNLLALRGFDPRTVQHVASRYIDRATPPPKTKQREKFQPEQKMLQPRMEPDTTAGVEVNLINVCIGKKGATGYGAVSGGFFFFVV